jgi:hypothetical protein
MPRPAVIPTKPPIWPIIITSTRNWVRIARALAPIDLRVPISRVLSETDTSIIFMSPMPAPKRVITPITAAAMVMPEVASSRVSTRELLLLMSNELGAPGVSPRIILNAPVAKSVDCSICFVSATAQVIV